MIGALALQGDVREHVRALGEVGAEARPVRRPHELDSVEALVIQGGESTTMSKLAVDFGATIAVIFGADPRNTLRLLGSTLGL